MHDLQQDLSDLLVWSPVYNVDFVPVEFKVIHLLYDSHFPSSGLNVNTVQTHLCNAEFTWRMIANGFLYDTDHYQLITFFKSNFDFPL